MNTDLVQTSMAMGIEPLMFFELRVYSLDRRPLVVQGNPPLTVSRDGTQLSVLPVITFADNHNLPDRALRFNAGVYQTVSVDLSTGTYGPDNLTYTVKRVASKDSLIEMPLPEGLTLKIDPDRISVYPHNQYRSTLRIETTADLASGTYWVCVESRLGQSVSGYRTIMVNVMGAQ